MEKKIATSKLTLSLGVVASFLLAACGDRGPQIQDGVPGVVDDKKFIEGGLEYDASLQQWMPEPDEYILYIRQCGFVDEVEEGSDDCFVLPKNVKKSTYEEFDVGDGIVFNR